VTQEGYGVLERVLGVLGGLLELLGGILGVQWGDFGGWGSLSHDRRNFRAIKSRFGALRAPYNRSQRHKAGIRAPGGAFGAPCRTLRGTGSAFGVPPPTFPRVSSGMRYRRLFSSFSSSPARLYWRARSRSRRL